MALTGNEQVAVIGVGPNGNPASDTFVTTTQEIANLSGGGGITGGTWNLNTSGQAPLYDAQIDVTGGGPANGLGILNFTAGYSHFYTYDGSEQFRAGSVPFAVQVWEARGGIEGSGPLFLGTDPDTTNTVSVNSNILSQGPVGQIRMGNTDSPILELNCALGEGTIINYCRISARGSAQSVVIDFVGGNDNVSGTIRAQAAGSISFANTLGSMAVFLAPTASHDYFGFFTSPSSSIPLIMQGRNGTDVAIGGATGTGGAIATNATDGFLQIPTCAGTPTGTPQFYGNGTVPIVFDSTNNKIYIYTGSWKGVAVA